MWSTNRLCPTCRHQIYFRNFNQHRSQHSTETALVKVFSNIVDALDDGNIAILAILNLTATFDTVDHRILFQRLQRSFGIDETTLCWFESYVIGRTQSVHLANNTTTPHPLVCSVPQGSVLGPLLFILYTADIGSIIAVHGFLHHCYTDDTQIYFFCRPLNSASLKDQVLSCIDDIAEWMQVNRFHLNPSKLNFCGSPHHVEVTVLALRASHSRMVK